MSNDYILKQVPSKLRIADVTMDISMTYIICCLHVFKYPSIYASGSEVVLFHV